MKSKFILLTVPLLTGTAASWGQLGHQTIALIAQSYLLPNTATEVQHLLGDSSQTYMANVATWADSYRNLPSGGFTRGFHFVNGRDGPPPGSCRIKYPEDCPVDGCIVSAIANYTERLRDEKLGSASRAEALRFLIHFIGDIVQPLHTEAFGAGANSIAVTFAGKPTNLHSAWDTDIPNRIVNTTAPTTLESLGWANNLAALINVGPFRRRVSVWLRDLDVRGGDGPARSAIKWAVDSNELVCGYAISVPPEKINGTEIGGEYYEGAVPVVVEQIAKGGIRLAGWLNLIFEGRTGF